MPVKRASPSRGKLAKAEIERKRAVEVREWLAAVVESSDDAIISKTLTGTIAAWNRGAEKIFGYSAAEAVGKSMLTLAAGRSGLSHSPAAVPPSNSPCRFVGKMTR